MEADSLSHLFAFYLPSLCLSAGLGLKDVPDLLPKHQPPPHPADMAGDTHTHACTHTQTRTHREKTRIPLMCFQACASLHPCARSLVQTHSYKASLSLLLMKEPSPACTHRVRLRHNQAQIHTVALDANTNACIPFFFFFPQACPIFKILSTPTHILPCSDTPTAAHVRVAPSWRTHCVGARQGKLVRCSKSRHLTPSLSGSLFKVACNTTPVVNGTAPADYCMLRPPAVIAEYIPVQG